MAATPTPALLLFLVLAAALSPLPAAVQAQPARSIGVYSGRHYNTDKALYREFTRRTGIEVRLLEAKDDALIQRVHAEGKESPADVLVLVDAARLDQAADLGLFRPLRSTTLRRDVPTGLRDSRSRWFALTRRVRAVVVNPRLVKPQLVRSYADLASPALKGKLCLRDRRSVYNQSLVADQLVTRGEAATTGWIRGMVSNLGQPVFSSDTPMARAVARGECGVGLVNTYYVARMLSGESGKEDQQLARGLTVVMPRPAHVNISGAGVTVSSRNPEAAQKLIEFLVSPTGGRGYAEANNEYPLRGVGDNRWLQGFGPFTPSGVSAETLGARNAQSVKLMESNDWK